MKTTHVFLVALGLCLSACPADDGGHTDCAESDGAESGGEAGTSAGGTTSGATTVEGSSSGDESSGGETSSVDTDDPPGPACNGQNDGGGEAGESCSAHSDCASGVCLLFSDAPADDDAVCGETPTNCGTRVTGTLLDFVSGEPVAGAQLVVTAALEAATNPTGATALIEATSDAQGLVDGTSESAISAPLGIVGIASSDGYYLTATGVSAPNEDGASYDVGAAVHDLWMVPLDALDQWSTELGTDAEVPEESLPIGDTGGAVGLIRDASGLPIAGATVQSANDTSEAIIRYLNDDGTFGVDETSDLGIFVVLNPAVPEDFEALLDGAVIGSGTAGTANGVVFTLIINAP